MSLLTGALRVTGIVVPPLASEIAYGLFGYLGAPETVHVRDRGVHERAIVEAIEVRGQQVVTYRWGGGRQLVVLTHGWRSRASRFSVLIEALESGDVTVIAFDAPGNGSSPGTGTTVLDYAAAITEIARVHGPVDTLIGHSLGVLASFLAARESVPVRRIVGVSGMYNADQLVTQFVAALGLGPRATAGLRRRIERRAFSAVANPWRRLVSELDPTSFRVPVLLVHDGDDGIVDPGQALLIADAHTGPVEVIITSGLGHNRILSDPAVVERIARFVLPVELETTPREHDKRGRGGGHGANES